jgi:hypothetical protein
MVFSTSDSLKRRTRPYLTHGWMPPDLTQRQIVIRDTRSALANSITVKSGSLVMSDTIYAEKHQSQQQLNEVPAEIGNAFSAEIGYRFSLLLLRRIGAHESP